MNPQHLGALAKANKLRLARAAAKAAVKIADEPRRQLHALISERPDYMARARVHDVLRWLPRVGDREAGRIMRDIGVYDHRTVEQLTPRQIDLLGHALHLDRDRIGVAA